MQGEKSLKLSPCTFAFVLLLFSFFFSFLLQAWLELEQLNEIGQGSWDATE